MKEIDARMSTRGRVTIPKAIRDELGIQPGSKVRFMRDDDGPLWMYPLEQMSEQPDSGKEFGANSTDDKV